MSTYRNLLSSFHIPCSQRKSFSLQNSFHTYKSSSKRVCHEDEDKIIHNGTIQKIKRKIIIRKNIELDKKETRAMLTMTLVSITIRRIKHVGILKA